MKISLLALTLVVDSCSGVTKFGVYCSEQYGMEFRADMRLDCPSARGTKEDLDRVARVAGAPNKQEVLFRRSVALYEEEDTLLGGRAGGYVELEKGLLHVATAGNERGVLRHEAFHLALWRLTGDADTDHGDSRWSEVN